MSATQITLSDGRVATLEPLKGRHIRQALRMQREADVEYVFALIALATKIDGAGIVAQDLDDMPARDVALLQLAIEKN